MKIRLETQVLSNCQHTINMVNSAFTVNLEKEVYDTVPTALIGKVEEVDLSRRWVQIVVLLTKTDTNFQIGSNITLESRCVGEAREYYFLINL